MTPLEAAGRYACLGLAVFPLRPRAKTPLTTHGHLEATTDHDVIEHWWRRWPDAGVGIACRPSRLLVVDVDPRGGGDESLADLERQRGPLPATWRALTGGNGLHAIFRAPPGLALRDGKLAPGIDVKANGYIVAAPSVHPTGKRYEWEIGHEPEAMPLAPSPTWLLERIRGGGTTCTPRPPDDWAVLVQGPIVEGARNDTLARLAGYLLRRRPAPRVVLELVHAVNQARCKPPLPAHEIERTVDSIARRELVRASRDVC